MANLKYNEKHWAFLKKHFRKVNNSQLAELFKEEFPGFEHITKDHIYYLLEHNGLTRTKKEQRAVLGNLARPGRCVIKTETQLSFIERNYTIMGDSELHEKFLKKFPTMLRVKRETIRDLRIRKGWVRTKIQDKEIKKRNKPILSHKISKALAADLDTISILEYSDGHKRKMIKTKNGWEDYMRWLYRKNFGLIPRGHVIIAKDGIDPLHATADQLQCLSKKEFGSKYIPTKFKNEEIGTKRERLNNGYSHIEIKVANGKDGWQHLNRYVWELHNGAIPAGHIIIAKPGYDRWNPSIDHLSCINRTDFKPTSIMDFSSDNFVAFTLTYGKGKEMRDFFKEVAPELIELQRENFIQQKKIREEKKKIIHGKRKV